MEEPLCIVCCKRPSTIRKVCSSCYALHDSTTGDRLTVEQRKARVSVVEEEQAVRVFKDIFRMERPR